MHTTKENSFNNFEDALLKNQSAHDLYNYIDQAVDLLLDADDEIGHRWKMPSVDHNIMFALTEIGETINEDINQHNAGYARNSDQRGGDYAKELADVGMMIIKYFISAAREEHKNTKAFIKYEFDFTVRPDGQLTLPLSISEALNEVTNDAKPESNIDVLPIINALVAYAWMVKTLGTVTYANPLVHISMMAALVLVVGNQVFSNKSFVKYLKEKLQRTREKIMRGDMYEQ